MPRSSTKKPGSVKLSKVRKDHLTEVLDFDLKCILEHGIRQTMHEYLQLLAELLINSEVIELVGKRSERSKERSANRWGSQDGSVALLEQRVAIEKPRVRTAGRNGTEVQLETYQALNDPTFLNEQAGAKLLAGLSTRNVPKVLEKLLDGRGIGRQTISNRAVQEMSKQLETFKSRTFGRLEFPVIFIDGVGLGDNLFVTAIGVDKSGAKHVLDFELGSTENSGTCKRLLSNLIERGVLDADGGHLFAIDGGKALRKAIADTFGNTVHVQRCLQHKKRNVEDKLPDYKRQNFCQRFSAAYSKKTLRGAEAAFRTLMRDLERDGYKAAAKSLLEGNSELLTLHRLKIEGTLKKSLCTTNIIESLFSNARYQLRNVKRWRKEEQMERWLAASLLKAEQSLRRVPGYTQMPKLIAALKSQKL
jgi:putative transposase